MKKVEYDQHYFEDINAQDLETMRPKYRRFLSYLPEGFAPKSIVDLGCGSGTLCAFMAEMFSSALVAGADFSSFAIERAQARCPGITFRVVDLQSGSPPFQSESADLVTAHEVLEHLREPGAFLRSVRFMLRPGGIVLLKTPNRLDLMRILSPLLFRKPWYADTDKTHVRYYSRFSAERLLRSYGFVDVRGYTGTEPLLRSPLVPAVPVVGNGVVLRGRKSRLRTAPDTM